MPINEIRQPRRKVIFCAGFGLLAVVVAACSNSPKNSAATSASSAPAGPGTAGAPTSGAQTTPVPSAAITKTADVPVGSGVIVGDIVVTQPTAGVFKGFSSLCTHAGCKVSEVTDGKIVCPCHGSEFSLDGAVAQGPAKSPLEAKPISVQGDSIVAG